MKIPSLRLLLLIFFLTTYFPVAAQQRDYVNNSMFWFEANIAGGIKGKFSYQLDYQHRRQAIPENLPANHDHLAKYPLLQTVRPWIHYQFNPAVRFSFAPLAWLGNWRLPENGKSVFFPEFRITPQVIIRQPIGRVIMQHRFRYEFRLIGRDYLPGTTNLGDAYSFDASRRRGRMRYMIKANIPITTKEMEDGSLYTAIFNEAMINTGKNIPNSTLFDQNRTYAGIGYRFSKFTSIEAGYLKQLAFRFNNPTSSNIDSNNLIHVFLFIENFSELFNQTDE